MDDLSVFGGQKERLQHVHVCFTKFREVSFSLNPHKCTFAVQSGRLLVHAFFEEGIVVDPKKIGVIM